MIAQVAAIHPDVAIHIYAFEEDFDPAAGRLLLTKALPIPTLAANGETSGFAGRRLAVERSDGPRFSVLGLGGEILHTPIVRQINRTPAAVIEPRRFESRPLATMESPAEIEGLETSERSALA